MKHLFSILLLLMIGTISVSFAETMAATEEKIGELKGQVDGMNETMIEMKNTLDALSKMKVSGYVQAQWQVADGDGIGSVAGGNFPSGVHQRFAIRRGRVKFTYDNKTTMYVTQLDITQSGVGIKDAYLRFSDPWRLGLGVTAGGFDRPFGFEIGYSSGSRESPERSRIFQTLFPGERDIGVQLSYAKETGPLSFLNAKVGVFNGTGIAASENDNNKDLIGRIGVQIPFYEQNMALDGGVSFYMGKVRNNSKFLYEINDKKYIVDSTVTNQWVYHDRNYLGLDFQYYADLPVIGGFQFRGEYITGSQPSTKSSNAVYTGATANTALYNRNVNGYYVKLIQSIGKDHQFIFKYDLFDPNTDVEGNDVGVSGAGLTSGDLAYTTMGLGLIHHWDANIKFVLYYDMVTNETANSAATGDLAAFKEDVKDNVVTFRMQYRF